MPPVWADRHATLLKRAKKLARGPAVSAEELRGLREEIGDLERSIDRPLPTGMLAPKLLPSLTPETPGRAPSHPGALREERTCLADACDGSGWLLDATDTARSCECRAIRRRSSLNRQSRRIIGRYLALSFDTPPLAGLPSHAAERLQAYCGDVAESVQAGRGLWFLGDEVAEAACLFAADKALGAGLGVLCYPADELLGRLRRLGAEKGVGGVQEEIEDRLAAVDLLVITNFDAPTIASRYPEPARVADSDSTAKPAAATPYAPAMSDDDLSQLFQILDARWMGEKATLISTRTSPDELEERLLHVSGWPVAHSRSEPGRRKGQVRRLLFRLGDLAGDGPLATA